KYRNVKVFEEILLIAADIDNDCFQEVTPLSLYLLPSICRRIHIYCDREDKALLISELTKHPKKRLGVDGPLNNNIIPSHIYTVDATDVNQGDNSLENELFHHWYYKDVKQVVADIDSVLHGVNDEDISGRIEADQGKKYRLKAPRGW